MFYISQKQESVPCLYGEVKPAEVAKGRNRLEKLLQMILKCYYFPRLEYFCPTSRKQPICQWLHSGLSDVPQEQSCKELQDQ